MTDPLPAGQACYYANQAPLRRSRRLRNSRNDFWIMAGQTEPAN